MDVKRERSQKLIGSSASDDGWQSFIGQTVGERYKVLSVVGSGTVSTVFKACDVSTVRTIALKVVRSCRDSDNDSLRLFQHNARLNVLHPNLVSVYSSGLTQDKEPWLATEYLDAPTLREKLDEGTLSPMQLLNIFEQVCDALSYLHSKGEVHLNLKPSTILLLPQGNDVHFVKITDFGLARILLEREMELIDDYAAASGSVFYMSPEQLAGEDLTHHSDIYSLGCLLSECLTGRTPFEGGNFLEVMDRHVRGEYYIAKEHCDEPALIQVIERCIARKPADRYSSSDALKEDLRRAFAHQPLEKHVVRPTLPAEQLKEIIKSKRREPVLFLLTCITILLLVVIVRECLQMVSFRG